MKPNTTVLVTVLVLFGNGCCCLPFLYPKTGAQGVVIDQQGNPVSNAAIQAYWTKWSQQSVMMPDQHIENFTSDGNGRWAFYTRDAVGMFIEVQSASGYESLSLGFDKTRVGPLAGGECRTNAILHLHKIGTPPQPKETK